MNVRERRSAVVFGAFERVNLARLEGGRWSALVEISPRDGTPYWIETARGQLRVWRTLDAAVAFFERAGLKVLPVLLPSVDVAVDQRGEP